MASILRPDPAAKDGPGSGYASYVEYNDPKYGFQDVPLIIATEENIKEYGYPVYEFNPTEIDIMPWPVPGKRKLCPGTGRGGGCDVGEYEYRWIDDMMSIKNKLGIFKAVYGRLPEGVSPDNRTHVLVRESNYHPDCGQIFQPKNGEAFVGLFALPGDDVTPEDFRAFYFDGSFGIRIKPFIWHQPIYPVGQCAIIQGSQGKVHACIGVDTVNEFGKWLKVPLKRELAQK